MSPWGAKNFKNIKNPLFRVYLGLIFDKIIGGVQKFKKKSKF